MSQLIVLAGGPSSLRWPNNLSKQGEIHQSSYVPIDWLKNWANGSVLHAYSGKLLTRVDTAIVFFALKKLPMLFPFHRKTETEIKFYQVSPFEPRKVWGMTFQQIFLRKTTFTIRTGGTWSWNLLEGFHWPLGLLCSAFLIFHVWTTPSLEALGSPPSSTHIHPQIMAPAPTNQWHCRLQL